jgi:hypothetical protein
MKSIPLSSLSLCVAALISFSSAATSEAQLVNGSFESGSFSPWVVNDPSGFTMLGSDSAFAHTGTFYANLGASPNVGTLSQTFNTTPGTTYSLSFWLAHDVTATPSNQFSVFWNGTVIAGSTLTNVGTFGYTNFTFTGLTAPGSTSTLQFQYRDNDDFFRLDTVSVVPEPSTYAFMLSGVGLLGLVQYRRAKARRSALQS